MQDIDLDIHERFEGAPRLELPRRTAQDTGVFSRMACHFCQNPESDALLLPQCETALLDLKDDDSGESSEMLLDNDDMDTTGSGMEVEKPASGSPEREKHDEWVQADMEDSVVSDPGNMEVLVTPPNIPVEQIDSPQLDENRTGVGFDETSIVDMIPKAFGYFEGATYHLDFDGDNLSIDEDEEPDSDTKFPMRSCATGKETSDGIRPFKKKPISSSWVMVQVKSKSAAKMPSNVRTRPSLNYNLALNLQVKLTEGA